LWDLLGDPANFMQHVRVVPDLGQGSDLLDVGDLPPPLNAGEDVSVGIDGEAGPPGPAVRRDLLIVALLDRFAVSQLSVLVREVPDQELPAGLQVQGGAVAVVPGGDDRIEDDRHVEAVADGPDVPQLVLVPVRDRALEVGLDALLVQVLERRDHPVERSGDAGELVMRLRSRSVYRYL